MGNRSWATPPQTTALTTTARVNARLAISGDDARVAELIQVASDEAVTVLGYGIARAELIETLEGSSTPYLLLGWAPVRSIGAVSHGGSMLDAESVQIVDSDAALISAPSGWVRSSRPAWAIHYWAGWLLPGDDVTSTAIAFEESDSSLNITGRVWPLLLHDDWIVVTGSAANSGTWRVVARTDAKLVVDGAVTTEVVGQAVTVSVRTLPTDIEHAVIERVKELRDATTSSGGGEVTSESIDGVSVSYSASTAGSSRRTAYETTLARRARRLA